MKNKVVLSVVFILIIIILFKAFVFSSKYDSDVSYNNYSLFIVSKYKESENIVSYNVSLNNDKFILKIYSSESVDISSYLHLKYGHVLNVTGKILVPEYMNNPGEFNYKYYLYSNNIYGEISVNKINSVGKAKFNLKERLIGYIYNYKEYLGNVLRKYMNSYNLELAKSILYGETLYLDEETKNSFNEVGLSHIMAISGSNITSVITILLFILSQLKFKEKDVKVFSLVILVIFVILTGGSLSTLRSGLMVSISVVGTLLNKKVNPVKSLFLAILIILFFYPFSIFNTGFILSVLATFGIIVFLKPLNKLTDDLVDRIKVKWLKKLVGYMFLNLWITISVQIMIIPVQINSFNTFSFTQVIFNILISGVSSLLTLFGAVFILFSYIPLLNYVIVKLINIFVSLLFVLVNFFKTISLNISIMDLPVISIFLYYIIVLSFIIKIYLKQFLVNKKYEINKSAWKKYSLVQIVLIIFTIVSIVLNIFYFKNLSSFVYFFNVGQGEMSYIKSGKNSVIVDIGSMKTNLAYNTVSNYFKMKNICGVNAIVISHMHTDHINGLEKYLENYGVGIVLYSKSPEETEIYSKFKEIVEKYNVNAKEVISGEIYNFGDICIEILLPKETLLDVEDSVNANSLVCKINVKDKKILYMGDGTYDTEKVLLKLYNIESVDILKVGHHGSKTSTTEEYIKEILPKYAVISAKKSYYNHPHKDVIEILKKYNVKILITEKIGAIKFNMYNL